jgi:hypothetical protein
MKTKIAVLFLVGLMCLTTGCSNTSPITKEPAPVSSSESKEVPDQAKPTQATEKTEAEKPQSAAQKEAEPTAEATVGVSERNTQIETVPAQRESGTTPPTQPSEPPQKSDTPERQPETTAPTAPPETEPPTPPATEAPKPTEQPQPTEPPTQEPTEPAFDIGYWISFAKGYAESVGLTLNSGAVYCWDNPIDADSGCIYLERDIQSRLNRYAADEDITDVWIWYESVTANRYRIYIGYA